MLTTDGISFSAKSAKESGLVFALILLEKEEINKILSQSLEKTKDMEAKVGRAKFLENKGVGFVDPGAKSTEIILRAYFESVL